MAKTKEQKSAHLEELLGVAKNAQSIVFVNFDRFAVKKETQLRSELTGKNIGYKVVKKTLLKKALTNSSIKGDMPVIEGMIAIAYGDDLIAPAREVYAFQKEAGDTMKIVGGVFEGTFMSQAEMMSIASIPSTKVLYSQLLAMLNSPIQGFAIVLNQYAEKKQA